MKRKLMILAATVTVMLAACNKEEQASPNGASVKERSALSLSTADNDRAANPLNPYDSIGVIHNQVMDVTCSYVQMTGDKASTSIRNQVAAFFKARYGTDITDQLIEMNRRFKKDYSGKQLTAVPKGIFNIPTETYLNRILKTIQSLKDANSYDTFKAAIVGIENAAVKDKSVSVSELQHIFMVAAIARYSLSYWLQMANTGCGGSDPMGFFHNIWKAINVAAADTYGAVDGLIHLDSPRSILEEASLDSSITSALM